MNPVAFKLFGISIMWYGIFIATGIVIAFVIASYTCKIKHIDYDIMTDAALIALPCAIVGARLYYVIFNFSYYQNNLIQILNIRQGGLAIHGGVGLGLIAGLLYLRHKKVKAFPYFDAVAPGIILAQALGRWGNFFNSEAHGGPVTYEFIKQFPLFIQKGMLIDGTYYHPTFLYESVWDLMVFCILLFILKKFKTVDGAVFFSYIGLYSIGRFFIEGLRTDSLMLGPLRMAQVVSILGVAVWLLFLCYVKFIRKTDEV
jgi:phosphatidylglycerol---prolipoprotein diacylglyceryl transferase